MAKRDLELEHYHSILKCVIPFSVLLHIRIMCDKKYYDLRIVVVFRLLR